MKDLHLYSTPEIVSLLGKRFKKYRLLQKMTQKEVADKTGITKTTIHKFETGIAYNISLSTLITLLKTIGCVENIDNLIPDFPDEFLGKKENEVKRIRHKKNEQKN